VHGLAPQNLSPDKRVDVCADSDEDRGSTPLASKFINTNRLAIISLSSKNINKNSALSVRRRPR
jgi:hypothetical protein